VTDERKAIWQCVTPGCRRARFAGDVCGACAKQTGGPRAIRVTRSTVYPTGETRTEEAQREVEMTDGRQIWWIGAREEAA
jgi:hypothetical protein